MNSYLLENKKACSILEKIKHFFTYYGEPKEFGSDNGKEFIIQKFKIFYMKKILQWSRVIRINLIHRG